MYQTVLLYGVGGNFAGSIFKLDKEITTIGRDTTRCSVVYAQDEPGISSVHCQLKVCDGYVELTDLASNYGTFLGNSTRLEKYVPYCLKNGDSFYLADMKNRFIIKIK